MLDPYTQQEAVIHTIAFDEITAYFQYLAQCQFKTVTKYELGFIATMENGLRIVAYVKA